MMNRQYPPIRTPIRRQKAETYLLVTLLSFAASVSLTRLFLYLTGYPQIGNSELHIAHVLWGGLFLFVAALLPLILVNGWVLSLSAIISGVGVGLFIDEVGKFITQTNDYFYPSAAPIIYVFFLLTVLLYVRLRATRRESYRADLYYIFEDLQEVLDHDLSENERRDIIAHLERVKRTAQSPDLIELAQHIEDFITKQDLNLVPEEAPWWVRWTMRLEEIEKKWLNRMRYRAVLAGALAAVAAWSLTFPMYVFINSTSPQRLQEIINNLVANQLVSSPTELSWFEARIALEISVGVILLIAAVLVAVGRETRGFTIAYIGLLLSLTVVNILVFYFDQFSTIINSTIQFIVLIIALRYRALYMNAVRKPR